MVHALNLKDRFDKINQRRLNIKKIPSKNWEPVCFSSDNRQDEKSKSISLKNNDFNKIKIQFLNKTIMKLYFSSNYANNNYVDDFSWTISETISKDTYSEWTNENGLLVFNNNSEDQKNIKITFDPSQAVLSFFKDSKNIFESSIRSNNKNIWLSMDFVFDHDQFKCFGLGEHTRPLDQKGKKFYLYWLF